MIIKTGRAAKQQTKVQVLVDFSEPGASNIMGDIMAPKTDGINMMRKIIFVVITVVFNFVDFKMVEIVIIT